MTASQRIRAARDEYRVYVSIHSDGCDEPLIYSLDGNDAVEWRAEVKRITADPDTTHCIVSEPDGRILADTNA